jgi:hypothetical protein
VRSTETTKGQKQATQLPETREAQKLHFVIFGSFANAVHKNENKGIIQSK